MKAAFMFLTTATGLVLIGLAILALLLMGPLSHFFAGLAARDLANAYGAQVSLADIKLRPFQQRIELQGLTIHNPEPFRTGPAIVVERVNIDLDAPAFLSGMPTARRILFQGSTVHLRHQSGEGTNLGALARNAAQYASNLRQAAGPNRMPPGLRVESLRGENTILRLASNLLPVVEFPLRIEPFEVDRIAERGHLVRGEVGVLFIQALLLEATGLPGMLDSLARILHIEAQEVDEA